MQAKRKTARTKIHDAVSEKSAVAAPTRDLIDDIIDALEHPYSTITKDDLKLLREFRTVYPRVTGPEVIKILLKAERTSK